MLSPVESTIVQSVEVCKSDVIWLEGLDRDPSVRVVMPRLEF